MYQFTDTNETGTTGQKIIPDDALVIGGKAVDEIIDGFITLRTKGINELQQEIETINYVGDGAYLTNLRVPVKTYTIDFVLKSDNNTALHESMTKLNDLVCHKQLRFSFYYIKDIFYYEGIVTNIEIEAGTLTPKGSIEIQCPDPYRYSIQDYTLNDNVALNQDLGIGEYYTPFELEIQANSTSSLNSNVTISTPSSKIVLLGYTGSSNVTYKLNFLTGELTVNNVNRNELIDIQSDISNFKIKQGERFTLSASTGITSCKLKFKKREIG